MKILIPLGGKNTFTNDTEYIKSLYEINRKTIFQYVYEFLNQIPNAEFIFVIKKSDVKTFHLDQMIKLLIPNAQVIVADGETKGAACTCLLAVDYIDEDEPIIISNCDQLFNENPAIIIKDFEKRNLDGGVVTFEDIHPRWSYVKIDSNNYVIEAAEKRPISKHATAGMYYYRKGSDFINSIEKMIMKNVNVNGNFYVCPSFNEMILEQKKIGIYEIPKNSYFNFKEQKGINEYEKYLNKKGA